MSYEIDTKKLIVSDSLEATEQNLIKVPDYELSMFRARNFKAFEDTGWIKLNSLVFILGNNSAGKSSLYQILQIIKKCSEDFRSEIRYEDTRGIEPVCGNFDDMLCKTDNSPYITFEFVFRSDKNEMYFKILIERKQNTNSGYVSYAGVQVDKGNMIDILKYYDVENLFFFQRRNKVLITRQVSWHMRCLAGAIRKFADNFQSISAQRIQPKRDMFILDNQIDDVGTNGQNTYNILFQFSELQRKEKKIIDEWLGKFGYTYQWMKSKLGNKVSLHLYNTKNNVVSNIVDNGFGVSQSLPLAVAIAGLNGQTVLVDSPEAFLQTNMQSNLGDLLVQGIRRGQLLIETGSEYVILRIQRRIAESVISAKDVFMYFLDSDSEKVSCNEILINDMGELKCENKNFKNFFSSDYEDIEKLDEARRKKLRE